MLLRDSGLLDVLEKEPSGQERWIQRRCMIHKARKVLDVIEHGVSLQMRLLFSIPLGPAVLVVSEDQVEESGRCFKVVFDMRSKVASFRAKDYEDATSWAASIEVFGGSQRRTDFPGFSCWLQNFDNVDDETVFVEQVQFTAPSLDDKKHETAGKQEAVVTTHTPHDAGSNEESNVDPGAETFPPKKLETKSESSASMSEVKRCAGYYFILSCTVSPKWRETFCVFVRQHLLEFAFPGDTSPLFIWSLSKSHAPRLVRSTMQAGNGSSRGHLQIFISGRFQCLKDNDNTANLDCGSSDLEVSIQLCAETDHDTRALFLSLPQLLHPTPSCKPEWNQSQLAFAVPSLSRQCARFVIQPFHSRSELSTKRAVDCATALSIAAHGQLLRNARVRASAKAHEFAVFYFLSNLGEDLNALAKHLSVELHLVGQGIGGGSGFGVTVHDLSQVGLQRLSYGRIVRMETDVYGNPELEYPGFSVGTTNRKEKRPSLELFKTQDWPNQALVASMVCKHMGRFRLAIKFKGLHIFGSPFRVEVLPDDVSAPHCTIGPVSCRAGSAHDYLFQVVRRDAFLNVCDETKRWKQSFTVTIESLVSLENKGLEEDVPRIMVVQNADRQTATVCFQARDLTRAIVNVMLNGIHVRGSPFQPALALVSNRDGLEQQSLDSADSVSEAVCTATMGNSMLTSSFDTAEEHSRFLWRQLSNGSNSDKNNALGVWSSSSLQERVSLSPRNGSSSPTPLLPVRTQLLITASTVAKEYVEPHIVNRVMDQVVALDSMLAPLIEVATIETRHRRPIADWKTHLSQWESVPLSVANHNPTTAWLQDRLASLAALETAFSRAQLPRRAELCEHVRQGMATIAGLLRDIRYQQLNTSGNM